MADEPQGDQTNDNRPAAEGASSAEPNVLNYRAATPGSASSGVASVVGSTVGLLVGLGAVSVGSAIPYLGYAFSGGGLPSYVRIIGVVLFAVLAGVCFWVTVRLRRTRPWSGGTAFTAGLVLGAGIAALLEGICFGVSSQ